MELTKKLIDSECLMPYSWIEFNKILLVNETQRKIQERNSCTINLSDVRIQIALTEFFESIRMWLMGIKGIIDIWKRIWSMFMMDDVFNNSES